LHVFLGWFLASGCIFLCVCLKIADSTGFKPSRHLQTALGLATTSWRGRRKMRIRVHSSLGWWQELQEASGIHVFRKVSFILWEFLQQGSAAFGARWWQPSLASVAWVGTTSTLWPKCSFDDRSQSGSW
jgi:hypothetical protein